MIEGFGLCSRHIPHGVHRFADTGNSLHCGEKALDKIRHFVYRNLDESSWRVRDAGQRLASDPARVNMRSLHVSRCAISEQQEWYPAPQRPGWDSDGRWECSIHLHSPLQAEICRIAAPVSCEVGEPPRMETLQYVPPGTHANGPCVELVDAQRVFAFAHLVWHQVRLHVRSTPDARQRSGSSQDSKSGSGVVAPEVGSPCAPRSMQAVAPAPMSLPASLETLLSQLARRRLGSLTGEERP
jgi:hypothetical protein